MLRFISFVLAMFGGLALGMAGDANRLTYLDENDPYYPSRTFPKLITPQWVGEPGVEAVVVLAIDDMRDPPKYEAYLRPILNRLKQIDGRAPLSIMSCSVDPKNPLLQQWLAEGLSLEVHTIDHPCPLLQGGDFAKAKSTYDRCVDLMSQVEGNRPVAFRMPCCDSLNTLSPRFFAEIFNSVTDGGKFLELDSSVFNQITPNDPDVPRELVFDSDGRDKFKKYVPFKSFVNTIEDYPYPYVINRTCWEFPCVVPTDWSAQHLQKPFHPDTVRDLKAALDVVVRKRGVYNLVFHPHGWIRNDQVVEIIDHAVKQHGSKVKFLNFREARDRLTKHFLAGHPLRTPDGQDNAVRILDINNDGFQDVAIGNEAARLTRIWKPQTGTWHECQFPASFILADKFGKYYDAGVHFGITRPDGHATVLVSSDATKRAWGYNGQEWEPDLPLRELLRKDLDSTLTNVLGKDRGGRLRDIDGDGVCELIVSNSVAQGIYRWNAESKAWELLPYSLPEGTRIADVRGHDAGLRFRDLDGDGLDDVLFSNERQYSIYLWANIESGWSRQIMQGTRDQQPSEGGPAAKAVLPIISREGTDNGAWFHSRHLWVQNEETATLPDLVDRRSFNDLLAGTGFDAPPLSPAAALKSMKLLAGFTIEQVAVEPLTMDPVAFDWGPDGKLWVAEMSDYPLGIDGQPGGRVRFLTDEDGDGKYETSTLFLDKLAFPNGVKAWGKGVLITAAPDILYAEDTDGDGKADRRDVLYSGFGPGNQQHRMNGLVWGLDNWLHVANGDSGGTVKSLRTGKSVNISGRDVRVRPFDGGLDAVTGQTQFGRNRDDAGNWFGCNNSNPMYQFVLEDYYIRRNPNYPIGDPRVNVSNVPGAAPVFPTSRTLTRFNDFDRANRFTSACSAMVYRDDLFGTNFAGNAFISEPVHNLVHREVVSLDGVTMTSRRAADEQTSEFLTSSDSWFRPTMIRTGPDGALWVADMYRLVIEHPQWIPVEWQQKLDLRAGHDKGRIYRIFPVHQAPRSIPKLSAWTDDQLVAGLESPSGWQRDMIQQFLVERYRLELAENAAAARNFAANLAPRLSDLVLSSQQPLARLHALCTLDGLEALTPEIILAGLADQHPAVRRHAVRLCESLKEVSPENWTRLEELVRDSDARVRLQLACTLGELPPEPAGKLLGELLQETKDRFIFAAGMSSLTKDNIRHVMLAVAQRKTGEPNLNFLETLLGQAAAFGDNKAVFALLKDVTRPIEGKYSAGQFHAVRGLMEELDRRQTSWTKLRAENAELPAEIFAQLDRLFETARKLITDPTAAEDLRSAAAGVLGRGETHVDEDVAQLGSLLVPQTPVAVQQAIVAALGGLKSAGAADALLAVWRGFTPALRGQVLDALLSREEWTAKLFAALESGNVLPQDIDASRRQRLLTHAQPELRERAEKLFRTMLNADRNKVVEHFRPALSLAGDAPQGKLVFTRICSQCHKLDGVGHEVGPDLAALTDKSAESLLIAVFDPNRAVEAKFLNYTAVTKKGKQFSGLLFAETGNSVTLRGPEAKETVLLRSDLDELTSTAKSTMPEGLEKDLSVQQAADLLAFISRHAPPAKRKEFSGNQPEVIIAGADGQLLLKASLAEIFGSTLVFEEKYGNLGYWSSADDHAVWTIDVTKPGLYSMQIDYACPDSNAGNAFEVTVNLKSVTAKVASSGSWDTYKQIEIGTVELAKGRQRLMMRAAGPIQTGALLDLRSIRLTPVKK